MSFSMTTIKDATNQRKLDCLKLTGYGGMVPKTIICRWTVCLGGLSLCRTSWLVETKTIALGLRNRITKKF